MCDAGFRPDGDTDADCLPEGEPLCWSEYTCPAHTVPTEATTFCPWNSGDCTACQVGYELVGATCTRVAVSDDSCPCWDPAELEDLDYYTQKTGVSIDSNSLTVSVGNLQHASYKVSGTQCWGDDITVADLTATQTSTCRAQLIAAADAFLTDFVAELDESGVTGDCPCWADASVLVPGVATTEQSCDISNYSNVIFDDTRKAVRSYGTTAYEAFTHFDNTDANWNGERVRSCMIDHDESSRQDYIWMNLLNRCMKDVALECSRAVAEL